MNVFNNNNEIYFTTALPFSDFYLYSYDTVAWLQSVARSQEYLNIYIIYMFE